MIMEQCNAETIILLITIILLACGGKFQAVSLAGITAMLNVLLDLTNLTIFPYGNSIGQGN